MTTVTLENGRFYRAKKPGNVRGYVNDRQIIYLSPNTVQYDGPAVAMGRNYPKVSREQFEKWAGEDVTAKLPPGEWLDWLDYKRSESK